MEPPQSYDWRNYYKVADSTDPAHAGRIRLEVQLEECRKRCAYFVGIIVTQAYDVVPKAAAERNIDMYKHSIASLERALKARKET